MSFDRDIFSYQYVLVMDFVRHSAYACAISKYISGRERTSNFWPQTYNAHIEAAVHDWCKVFGSEGPNPTHWRKTPNADIEPARELFRKEILAKTGFTKPQWESYWESMRAFRDTYAAHVEIGASARLPKMDPAVKVAFAYDDWVRDLIKPDVVHEPRFDKLYDFWIKDCSKIVKSAEGIKPSKTKAALDRK
jgi:hypothetical protein